jgi:hypothetical protein
MAVTGFVQQLVPHSQPSAALELQSRKPLLHVPMAHAPPEQAAVACAGAHEVSQPSVGVPLQSRKPLVQLSEQLPALHEPWTALQQVVPQICEPVFSVYEHVPPAPGHEPAPA